MKRLIECVPNFSEGRDNAKVDAIVAAETDSDASVRSAANVAARMLRL